LSNDTNTSRRTSKKAILLLLDTACRDCNRVLRRHTEKVAASVALIDDSYYKVGRTPFECKLSIQNSTHQYYLIYCSREECNVATFRPATSPRIAETSIAICLGGLHRFEPSNSKRCCQHLQVHWKQHSHSRKKLGSYCRWRPRQPPIQPLQILLLEPLNKNLMGNGQSKILQLLHMFEKQNPCIHSTM